MPSLKLRAASLDDAEKLFQWRNDPQTRQASHSHQTLTWDDHCQWLARALENPDRHLMIAEKSGEAIGTVRADKQADGWVLSWTINPRYRGQGLATPMVKQLLALLSGCCLAEVRLGNVASAKVARKCGLEFWKQHGPITVFRNRSI